MAVFPPAEDILRFGLFELDVKAGQLRKGGARIRLPQQPIQLLAILLERPGEVVTREELRQRLWASDVFVDFDHGLNKSVQKLRDALGDSANSPRYIETIPRVGYRFLAPVSSVATAEPLVEATLGNGFHATAAIGESLEPLPTPRRESTRWHWFVLAGCTVLLATVPFWLMHRRREQQLTEPIRSLAVLPLDNLSGDREQDYFADGMTDELTTMLAKDSNLRIVSRTSAMQYKGAHRPLREIAQALGVDGIVEGSVERTGSKVHMTLQLIQGPSDTHVWAESYDRDADDLVSLPDEAATAIAKKTGSAAAERIQEKYVNPEAHDAYLRGRYLWFAGKNDEAEKYFQKAVELQPDYALGWVGVSEYYGAGMVEGKLDPREARQPFESAAQRAAGLDDSLAPVHNNLCAVFFFSQWDLVRADRECLHAIALDPQFSEAYHLRAKILASLNRKDEAIAAQKKATELDPFSRPWGMGYIYTRTRRYDAAIEDARQRLVSNPRDPDMFYILAAAYRCKGMLARAAQNWEEALILSGQPADAASIRHAFARSGYRAVLHWNLANMEKVAAKCYVSPVDLALQHAQLGERDETLKLLEEAYQQHSPNLLEDVQSDPAYDFLHSDPRYRAVIQKTGLPPAY